ncbi:MAG: O-antigen ligase family protein [Candidatus Kapabacteria bacterium]|nr:O-antigen ligase family protein [Candidatus Kapabacteria bacterium]
MLDAHKKQFLFSDKLLIVGLILSSIFFAAIILASVYFDVMLYVLPVIAIAPLFYFVTVKPKIWLYTLLALTGIFFQTTGGGISAIDVVMAIYFLGSILAWFFHRMFVIRKKVAENIGDWLVLAFFILIPLNLIIVIMNDADPELWLRETLMMAIVLMYFPIRDIVRTEADIKKVLLVFAIVIAGVGTYQLYDYYIRVTAKMVYAYELIHSMSTNQTLYTAASLVGLIFLITTESVKVRIFSIIFTAMSVAFLFSTFSRTFWVILVLSVFLIFLIVPFQKKIRMALSIGFLVIFIGSSAFLLMRDNVTLLYEASKNRLLSSTKVRDDISLRSRLIEWEQVLNLIYENPLGGNGLGKHFHYYEPIRMQTKHTSIIHNGYLFLPFRLGIPLSLFYFSFLTFYVFKTINLLPKARSEFEKSLIYSIIGVFMSLFISNYTSSQFFYRDGIFVTAMIIAFICILERIINQKSLSESTADAN